MNAGAERGSDSQGQLRWLCRRGMKELDVLLEGFLAGTYSRLTASQQAAFQRLLQMEDPDLHAALMGQQKILDSEIADVIERIRRRA